MNGVHSCANCHSFSRDGKTMGMDLDGPRNDKGLYALFPMQATSTIRSENVIAWSTYRGKLGGKLRVAFMSQVSPDGALRRDDDQRTRARADGLPAPPAPRRTCGRTTTSRTSPTTASCRSSTRRAACSPGTAGARACCSRCPGPTTRAYVHTNATWSPDGSYLVFARAEASDAYPEGWKPARAAQRPERDADPVRPLPHPVQRRPRRDGRADRRGVGERHEQQLPEGLARRAVHRLRAGEERSADAAGRQALHRARRRAARRA